MEKEELTILIAGLIRANVHGADDVDDCVADEDECLRTHPIHLAGASDGVTRLVYADVDGMAQIIAEGLTSRFVVQT